MLLGLALLAANARRHDRHHRHRLRRRLSGAYLLAGLALTHFIGRWRAPWLIWVVYLGLFFLWPFFMPLVVLAGLLESTLRTEAALRRRLTALNLIHQHRNETEKLMQVILLERIGRLGQMGDVVNVKNGYARNFLLPQKKALRATQENLARFEKDRAQLEARDLELKKEAEAVAGKLDGKSFIAIRQAGDTGQLYGSVTTRDIAEVVTPEASASIVARSCSTGRSRRWASTPSRSLCIPRSSCRYLSTWPAPRTRQSARHGART